MAEWCGAGRVILGVHALNFREHIIVFYNSLSRRHSIHRNLVEIQTVERAHHNSLSIGLHPPYHIKVVLLHLTPVARHYMPCIADVDVHTGFGAEAVRI